MKAKKEVANFLYQYNLWRRGCEIMKQPDPKIIGRYLDEAIALLKK